MNPEGAMLPQPADVLVFLPKLPLYKPPEADLFKQLRPPRLGAILIGGSIFGHAALLRELTRMLQKSILKTRSHENSPVQTPSPSCGGSELSTRLVAIAPHPSA